MTVFVFVVELCPLKDLLNSLSESIVSMRNKTLAVSWDVKSIQILQLELNLLNGPIVVYRHNSSPGGFQEFDVGGLHKLLFWKDLLLCSFLVILLICCVFKGHKLLFCLLDLLLLYTIEFFLPNVAVSMLLAWDWLSQNAYYGNV